MWVCHNPYTWYNAFYHLSYTGTIFGIDWDGPIPLSDDTNIIEVVQTINPIQELDFEELQATVSPLNESDCQGVDLFIKTLECIHHRLS